MGWLLGENWFWLLLSFLLGLGITLFLILRKVEVSTVSSKTTYAAAGAGAAGVATAVGLHSADTSTTVDEPAKFAAAPPVAERDLEAERLEAERVEAERAEPERAEAARVEAERAEAARVETERAEVERAEAERAEAERAEAERAEAERLEAERAEAERAEAERAEAERVEAERVEAAAAAESTSDSGASTQAVGFAATGAVVSRFGEGSADPLADGASPDPAYTIKGNEDSMLFHPPVSPYYGRTKAEVWFDSEDRARSAGFTRWDEKERTAPVGFASLPAAGAFGEGSADPLEGGASPHESFTVKGNADSMLFHPPESPYYGRTIAEVWFDSEDRARTAGFTRWNEKEKTAPVGFASLPAAGAYGEGSADPLADGASPHESFTVKGNADSMLFHPPESPYYGRTVAEVWFDSEDRARAAGFTRWDER